MKRLLLAAAVAIAMTGTALANQCPKLMAEIDAALAANPQISAEQQAEVLKLRGEGEAQHAAGKHDDAVATLDKAKAILGLK
ncbi:MAG TPA: hypothetical protein VIK47_07850 [Kiloniellales bacterium]